MLEMNTKLNLTMMAVGNQPATGPVGMEYGRVKVPELRPYGGARDAKDLENFLFDMEHYFRVVRAESEDGKVAMATMYLSADAKVWWRTKYDDIQNGRCTITTWDDLERELKTQFLPENVAYIARRHLRELKHTRTIREYVKKFSGLMSTIMSRGITLHPEDDVEAGLVVLEGKKLPTGNIWEMDGEKNKFQNYQMLNELEKALRVESTPGLFYNRLA
ncbi:uncharacterized protein LOC133785442 [Humulus lupulus]|uniref:uncharacterized protein LOC133785442 n=1 Tax=Humulus lupulus TaxID=3486 RepID=UPI002B401E71|nr:uncharacterized protein LOC133785442 [Humulus lupulus]